MCLVSSRDTNESVLSRVEGVLPSCIAGDRSRAGPVRTACSVSDSQCLLRFCFFWGGESEVSGCNPSKSRGGHPGCNAHESVRAGLLPLASLVAFRLLFFDLFFSVFSTLESFWIPVSVRPNRSAGKWAELGNFRRPVGLLDRDRACCHLPASISCVFYVYWQQTWGQLL